MAKEQNKSLLSRVRGIIQRVRADIKDPYTPRNGKFSVAQQIGMLKDPEMLSGKRPVPGTPKEKRK